MTTSVIVILAVFVAFLALIGGAAVVGFVWFLHGLNKRLEAVVAALGPLAGDGALKQAMLSLIAIANFLPVAISTIKASNEAFSVFAAFATGGKAAEPLTAVPGRTTIIPPVTPEVSQGEFIPPPADIDVIDEAMKDHLRKQGIELDPSRIDEPLPSQMNGAQV